MPQFPKVWGLLCTQLMKILYVCGFVGQATAVTSHWSSRWRQTQGFPLPRVTPNLLPWKHNLLSPIVHRHTHTHTQYRYHYSSYSSTYSCLHSCHWCLSQTQNRHMHEWTDCMLRHKRVHQQHRLLMCFVQSHKPISLFSQFIDESMKECPHHCFTTVNYYIIIMITFVFFLFYLKYFTLNTLP